MDSTSALVVKVSYGGVLRRFRVPVKANGQLDLDMASLRGKIAALFNLPVDDGFFLTYSDEDGDVVALVDDNDLFDVTNQRLKFLKIDVQLNTGMTTNSIATERSGRSSSASGMPDSQNPVAIIHKGINDVMMAVPNPMRDTISKVYIDLTSKAASSSPVVGELFDCISKLGKLSISQEGTPCSPVTKPGSSVPSAGEKNDISKKSQAGKKPATSGHVPTSMGVGASFNECPFSGVNGSSLNPMNLNKYPLGVCHSKKGSNGDYWTSSLGVFHKGIQCDGCAVVPITGPRFKSKVKEDYDLCNNCFSVMGNEWDYTRMDEPVSVRHLHPFGGQRVPFSNPWLVPVPQPHHGGSDFRSTWTKLDSRFVLDVNVIDGTVVAPSAPFTKIWKMRNNGSLVWPRGTQIFWIGGDRFSNSFAVDLQIPAEGVPINGELDVKVDFVAPELPGRYISYWMMASPIGVKFGQRVWVSINVDASLKGTDANEFHGLNLNAFPDETFAREFTGINVNYEPAQTGSSSVNGTLKGADLEREAAGPQIPGNDDLLVGDVEPVVPNTLTPSSSSSSSLVGFRNMRTVEALGGGYSFTMDTPAPLQEDIEKNDLETTMLKELEEMGFKEIDLNKEILKENEYNLEQSVEALCGVSEWDPILEELQEMGFSDEVTNKRLLKKNNGSIKDGKSDKMFSLLSFALIVGFIAAAAYLFRSKLNVPPSPIGFPVIGHLHLLKDPVHRCLHDLSRNLGPVFSLRLGSCRAVVVTSASAAEEFLSHENDVVFANRPISTLGKYVAYNNSIVSVSPYGDHWRNLRRICTVEIFSAARLRESSEIRRDEVRSLVRTIHKATSGGGDNSVRVELRPLLSGFTLNVLMRMVAGKRYYGEDNTEAKEVRELISETFELAGFTYAGDFLPILKLFDFNGYVKRVKKLGSKLDKFLQGLVDEHRGNRGKTEFKNTVITHLLTLQESQPEYYTDQIIKGLVMVMIVAGTDTTAVSLEWAMANLLKYPDVLAKAKEELNNVASSKGRLMEESDTSTCTYINNVISETLRLYPAGPMLVPHASSVDCKVSGYDIPRGTWLFINAWAIQRDPKVWDDPEAFKPERFDSEELKTHHGKFLPFGIGRRACPGMGLAQIVLSSALGSLIQCFDWERDDEMAVDMSEGTGLTMPKAVPLVAKCKSSPILDNVVF